MTDNRANKKTVQIAVGIVIENGLVFLTKRADDAHQGGKWEFPGGKVEAGETTEQALSRELAEEIGIEVTCSESFMLIEHDYPEKKVILDFAKVSAFKGTPRGCEGQVFKWFELPQLAGLDFPAANNPVIEALLSTNT